MFLLSVLLLLGNCLVSLIYPFSFVPLDNGVMFISDGLYPMVKSASLKSAQTILWFLDVTKNGTLIFDKIEETTHDLTWFAMVRQCLVRPEHRGCKAILDDIPEDELSGFEKFERMKNGTSLFIQRSVCKNNGIRDEDMEELCFHRNLTLEDVEAFHVVSELAEIMGKFIGHMLDVSEHLINRIQKNFGIFTKIK